MQWTDARPAWRPGQRAYLVSGCGRRCAVVEILGAADASLPDPLPGWLLVRSGTAVVAWTLPPEGGRQPQVRPPGAVFNCPAHRLREIAE